MIRKIKIRNAIGKNINIKLFWDFDPLCISPQGGKNSPDSRIIKLIITELSPPMGRCRKATEGL
jgi:hypothetical protein